MLGHQAEQLHRVGLVGAGEVVRRFYLPVFRSRADIRVQAICSRDRRRATEVAQLLDIPTVAADHRALLDDEGIESVLVCTPPHTHLEIASHAFGRGKNVLLEKPPCRTYEEFASLQALAARCRRVLDVTFNNSAREDNAWLIDAVKQGRIGAVELIELEWLRTKPRPDKAWARSAHCAGGGGVLADLGSHLLRIGVALMPRARWCVAYCTTTSHASSPEGVEDIACANIIADDAVQLTLKVGWGMQMNTAVRVSIVAHGTVGSLSNKDYPGASSDGYSNVLDRFLAHARAGKQSDLTPADRAMRLMHALYESSRVRVPITVGLAKVLAGSDVLTRG